MIVNRILSLKGRDVATIEPGRTLSEAARVLAERRIGALLIVDGQRPVAGIISGAGHRAGGRHARRQGPGGAGLPFHDREGADLHGRNLHQRRDGADDPAEIPACAGRRRRTPVGIISIGDVVKLRLEEVEAETQAIKEYIATA